MVVVVYACNSSTQEAEAEGLQVWGQLEQHNGILFKPQSQKPVNLEFYM
jgi:hypothetical protein